MLVNLPSYCLGYPRPYGDRVTNIRGRGCLYEGDSLKNHYPRGGGSFEGGAQLNIYYQGGAHSRGALIREGALFRGNTVSYFGIQHR